MPKKITAKLEAELRKNKERGGAWIAEFSVTRADYDKPVIGEYSAWSNASAGKRWLKSMVLEHTNKKSIKMVATSEVDEKGKPILFNGEVAFKVEI
jgi:hypothetical protein